MAKVLLKNSFTATSVPAGLSAGELAVNVTDRKLFVGNAVGGVVTLIDPNALVTSVNGVTGAVINVARTNEGNTYSVKQVMNAGLTASSITVANTIAQFNATVGENYFGGTVTYLRSTTTTVRNATALLSVTPNTVAAANGTLRLQGWDGDITAYNNDIKPQATQTGDLVHTLPATTDTLVGRATTDTLTNKTLTSPVISTITNTGTLTLPTTTGTLVGRTTTDTLTNKTLTAPVISTITNTGTLTLPTSTDTLVGRATTDTLTNKTLTSPVISTITNTGTITLPTTTGTLALLGANTFTGLQTFSAGITSTTLYASAGVTFNSTSAHTGLGTFSAGISASGATFSGNITAPNIVTGISGATGSINLVAGTNITIAQSGKTFTFSSSSSGGTQVGVTSSGQLFDVKSWAFSYCDFHGGPGPFGAVLGASGGDVVYYVDSPSAHLFSNYQKYTGVASLRTTAVGSYIALGCVTTSASYTTAVGPFSMGLTFEFRTRISTDYGNDSTATNNFTIYAGVDEQAALYPTFNTNNGAACWFEYNHASNSGNWTANLCEYFGRTASVGTTFAYTNSDNKFDIIRGISGATGHFFMYINGVNVAGFSFDQGLLGQGQGNARIVVRRTASAAGNPTRRTFVDYLSILQQRGT